MLESIEHQYLAIGHITRSHGINGEVLITSDVLAPQLFDVIDLAYIQNVRGDLIPARIESVRVQQKNDRLSFFLKFEHVTDRNQAEALKNYPVYVIRDKAEPLVKEEDAGADYHSFDVIDESNTRVGVVNSIIENPAHPILEIITTDKQQLLVPFVDEYILTANMKEQTITCHNLDQLSDL